MRSLSLKFVRSVTLLSINKKTMQLNSLHSVLLSCSCSGLSLCLFFALVSFVFVAVVVVVVVAVLVIVAVLVVRSTHVLGLCS